MSVYAIHEGDYCVECGQPKCSCGNCDNEYCDEYACSCKET
jgi:hypothetical protein